MSRDFDEVIKNLTTNGFETFVVENQQQAKEKVLALIPKGSEVMTMSSVTLQTIGLTKEINESKDYISIKNKLSKMNKETQGREMHKIGGTPQIAVGSVHAITKDGHLFIASNTGSQLPAYVYTSDLVVFVIGKQKLVKDDQEALARIYDYVLPKESERLSKQHGDPNLKSFVSKLLIISREIKPGRIKIVFVEESLGF